MKVLIATGLYPPEIGGPATYTVLLENELPRHGHSVEVLPFSHSRRFPRVLRHIHFLFCAIKMGRTADIFFAQDVASVGLPTLVAARLLRKKFYVRVPGDYAWEQSAQRYGVTDSIDEFQLRKYSFRVEMLRFIQRSVTKNADKTIVPSEYFKKLVSNWGVVVDKIFTIYNGVDLNIIPIKVDKPAPLTIVSAGRLVPWKGFEKLILIMTELPHWHLAILGDGPEKNNLKLLVATNHLEDRVHFLGAVSREEVFGWCATATAFVLNTKFESFSYQIVEAMSSGVPVVTTNVGSLPELICSGEEGILVEPDDEAALIAAIKSVVIEKSLWQIRCKSAQEKARNFSIEKTVGSLCRLMESEKI